MKGGPPVLQFDGGRPVVKTIACGGGAGVAPKRRASGGIRCRMDERRPEGSRRRRVGGRWKRLDRGGGGQVTRVVSKVLAHPNTP